MNARLVGLLATYMVNGCVPSQNATQSNATSAPTMMIEAQPMMATAARANAIANGRAIFRTGKDLAGVQITASKRPLYSKCAACHGTDGSGGKKLPSGAMSADLRHKALVSDRKHPYNQVLLERAISTGIDNDGKPLSPVMPRWTMSKRDLADLAIYVLTQLK